MMPRLALTSAVILLAAMLAGAETPAAVAAQAGRTYWAYVGAESADLIHRLRFDGATLVVERTTTIGEIPNEMEGPHGLQTSRDGKFLYMTTGHGRPEGKLWIFDISGDADKLVGPTGIDLGMFPASVDVTPDGLYTFSVNFNLHGDMVPSSVSVVATDEMLEVARIPTCVMPHGSRLNARGTRHYSACMMDDELVEIDTRKLAVSRTFLLRKGQERGTTGAMPATAGPGAAPAAHDAGGHGMEPPKPGNVSCSPTWAQPTPDGRRVFVACNKASEIAEIDAESWTLTRRLPAGEGVYNLAVTHDGRLLVATNKRGQSVSVFDAGTGRELKRLATKRKVVHGVAITADDRYAFISVEGIGSEPGTVEVIDLRALATVATVDVGPMAGGIEVMPGPR